MTFRHVTLLAAGASLALAQASPVSEYSAKVVLLERVSRFVDWPAKPKPAEAESPFILAVVGRNPFGDELDAYFLSHPIKGRAVRIKYFQGPADLGACDLLFIASSERKHLKEILAKVALKPVLTVGDSEGFGEAGVIVNIIREQGHLGFEVNVSSAKSAGLQLASSFLQIAKKK